MVITCPGCTSKYESGIDHEEFLELQKNGISTKVVCPSCEQWIKFPEFERIFEPNFPRELVEQAISETVLIEDNNEESIANQRIEKPWWKFW